MCSTVRTQERRSNPAEVCLLSVDGVTLGTVPAERNGRGPVSRLRAAREGRRGTGISVSVVIPAKNEAAKRLRPDIRVIGQDTPGKGAAVRAGFAAAHGDFIVMIDADGSMDPREIERFVDALHSGCEFVKGSRFAPGGGTRDISTIRRLGNGVLRTAVNTLYRTHFSDLCYGFIGFHRDKLGALRLRSDGFEIETEMTVRAVTASLRIGEVASFESERQYGA